MHLSNIVRIIVIIQRVWSCVNGNDVLPSLPKCKTSMDLTLTHVEIPAQLMSNSITTIFWLLEQSLTCPSVLHNISIPIISNHSLEEDDYSDPEGSATFDPTGILKYEISNYWKNEYCLQSMNETEVVISLCEISCSDPKGKICVPKCCGWGKMLHFANDSNVSCIEVEDSKVNWKPDVYHPHNASTCLHSKDETGNCRHIGIPDEIFHYQNIFSGCDEKDFILDRIAYDDTPFAFSKDGLLRVADYKLNFDQYCIDSLGNGVSSTQGRSHAALACICANGDPYISEKLTIDVLYVVVMFISAFFLLLTVIVYILIWDKQNIHGWTVFSLSVSMGLMLIFLGSARLISLNQGKESTTGTWNCVLVGILAHFFFLTTFSLLTCLSFDLWWTFRTLAPSVGRSKGILRFRMYLLFSLGFPFLIVSLGFILDKLYGHVPKYDRSSWRLILPEYGIDTCYISDKYAQGAYIFLPVAILLLANLLFFLTTMWIMYQYHKNTQTARKNSAKQKQTLYLFTKLFFVMGVTWTVEVIEYLCAYARPEKDGRNCTVFYPPGRAWITTDIFNILQGIAIFCIFCAKKKVMLHLSRRSAFLRGKSGSGVAPSGSSRPQQQTVSTPPGSLGLANNTKPSSSPPVPNESQLEGINEENKLVNSEL